MSYVERPGKPVFRHGKRIETIELVPASSMRQKRHRKAFKVDFVQIPLQWIEALSQTKSVSTYRLAHTILVKEFEREHRGGEIILSAKATRMPDATRRRAARELVSLGLIQLEVPRGKRAARVLAVRKFDGHG